MEINIKSMMDKKSNQIDAPSKKTEEETKKTAIIEKNEEKKDIENKLSLNFLNKKIQNKEEKETADNKEISDKKIEDDKKNDLLEIENNKEKEEIFKNYESDFEKESNELIEKKKKNHEKKEKIKKVGLSLCILFSVLSIVFLSLNFREIIDIKSNFKYIKNEILNKNEGNWMVKFVYINSNPYLFEYRELNGVVKYNYNETIYNSKQDIFDVIKKELERKFQENKIRIEEENRQKKLIEEMEKVTKIKKIIYDTYNNKVE